MVASGLRSAECWQLGGGGGEASSQLGPCLDGVSDCRPGAADLMATPSFHRPLMVRRSPPGGTKRLLRGSQGPPKGPPEGPGGPQEAPKRLQEAPKKSARGFQEAPRGPREAPKTSQEAPQECRQSHGERRDVFFNEGGWRMWRKP